jgi:tyrosine-protein phosphatase non-receptor type 9
MLKGSYPARLKKVLIVTAPMWFRAPFKILRLFVKEKLRDRVYTVNIQQLAAHIPAASLPRRLGGTGDVNHCGWVSRCLQVAWHKSALDDDDIATYVASLASRPSPADSLGSARPSISSASPCEGIWDTEALNAALSMDGSAGSVDFDWDAPLTASSVDTHSLPSWLTSRKRSVELSPVSTQPLSKTATVTEKSSVPTAEPLLLLSPPPAKRRLSSNAGEASIHGPEPGGLTIKELVEYCRIKGQRGLIKDYRIIKDEPPNGTFDISKSKLNITKNRYTDVLCLDETRVILRTAGGDPSSDYIHANFVDGYRQKNAYISTQGWTFYSSGLVLYYFL